MENEIKVGDKVRINLDAVYENGMVESENVELYLIDHPDEVYIVKGIDGSAPASIELDHSIVGITSFCKDELILVNEEAEKKVKEELLRERIVALMGSDDSRENYEKIAEALFDSVNSDDESYSHIGYNLLKAFLDNDADGIIAAICGWSMRSLLAKAKLIPDEEGVFVGTDED